jgi:hypothetical protein
VIDDFVFNNLGLKSFSSTKLQNPINSSISSNEKYYERIVFAEQSARSNIEQEKALSVSRCIPRTFPGYPADFII